jgi:hypothetical protein
MPDRFSAFMPKQAAQLAREHDRVQRFVELWWKRIALAGLILLIALVASTVVALYKVQQASDAGDRASRLAIAVNRAIIADQKQRTAEAQAAAKSAAASSYAACRHLQEQILVQREFYHLVLPKLDFTRTPDQQAAVQQFYHDLAAYHILTLPKCQKPPKGAP